jgi:adenylate cyclase
VSVRRLRIITGLILFTYLTTHFLNHALGLISLEAMETGRLGFLALWRNPVGTLALYGALLTHYVLALVALYRRRHLRMPATEAAQLVLGLAIPPLLVSHIVGTRLAHAWFDVTDSYTRVLLTLWQLRPDLGLRQALVLSIAWIHGCIGVHYSWRLRPSYPRLAPFLLAAAVLLPTLALLGFAQAGREVASRAATPAAVAEIFQATGGQTASEREHLERMRDAILAGVGVSLAGALFARQIRQARGRRRLYHVSYPGDRQVAVALGTTVLEASRSAGIPHASVCGGRGRCSTCRVRIVRGLEELPAAAPEELRVLGRIGAPPNVRLACQLRPVRNLSVVPLLPAGASAREGFRQPVHHSGQEREVIVLFADLRQFTRFAEGRLPYDVVFLLNRYFDAVGGAVERSGGVANQFTGDGVMALFGVEGDPAHGCRAALAAAGEIVHRIDALTSELGEELPAPLRIGIGIHAGPAVVGQMGHGVARYLTAVGDTVHVASRLQDLTKEYDCQLVLSGSVAERAGLDVGALPQYAVSVRNRTEPVVIYVVKDVRSLTLPR